MLLELIAAIAAGFAGAGIGLLLRRLSAGKLPRFVIPSMAGVAMLGFMIWTEYTWFPRTAETLPDAVVVTSSHSEQAAWRPWSYLFPLVTRFAAVDRSSIRRNDKVPGQLMADVLFFARRTPVAKLPVLIDCAGRRRADIADGMQFDDDGAVVGADWVPISPDDPLAGAVCPST